MSSRRLVGILALILGLAFVGFGTTRSNPVPAAAPIVAARGVSVDATSDNGQRKLARTSDGTLYLTYSGPVEGVEQAQVSFSLDDGQSWKPEVVLAQPGVWSDLATLAAGEDGRLDAAWVDYTTVGQVWYGSLRQGRWSAFAKVSPGDTYAGFPAMAIHDGVANLLWYAAPPDASREHGSAYEILHTFQSDDAWSTPSLLSSNSEDALNPALAIDPDGGLQAAWFQVFQGIYGAQVAEYSGGSWTFPALISAPADTATGVSIEIDGAGASHLVWEQSGDDNVGIAYSRRDGSTWSEPEMLSTAVAQDPVVSVDEEDRVFVLWSEAGSIRARVWDGDWSAPIDLGNGSNPTTLSGTRVMAAWTRPTDAGPEVATTYLDLREKTGSIDILVMGVGVVSIIGGLWLAVPKRRPGSAVAVA